MPRRAASVTQADIARAIRALQAAGLSVHCVVVRQDGIALETLPRPGDQQKPTEVTEVANKDRVPFL